ncbi:hypothetical protein [Epilithonimonas mollis]|uniref:Uncharacterized protein n=1 Tax=Epilithonimonas mollis TaxID=216903 RepID=A0A1M6U279_9FLAO|nr:hypothetical protein [Epilithonimonas mollis]SHK63261.1 hypothetical protein SAMN05444371_3076 [Epilithonimonas mollis]
MKKLLLLFSLSAFTIGFSQSKDFYFQDLREKVLLTNAHNNFKYEPDKVVLYGKCIKYAFGYNFNTMRIFNNTVKSNPWDNCDECKQKIKLQCESLLTIGQRFYPQQMNMEADYSDEVLKAITTDIKNDKNSIPKEYVTEVARCLNYKKGILYKNMTFITKKTGLLSNETDTKDCNFILNLRP